MFIKKSVAAVGAIALLAVGYVGGVYIGWPNTNDAMTSGDIGKAQQFKSLESEEDINALQEQLQTDTVMQVEALQSALILSCRINEIDSIADASIKAVEGIKPLEGAKGALLSLKKKTANAKAYHDKFMEATAKVISGEKVEGYEQLSNNALLAFTVLDNNLSCCAQFVDLFCEYIEENENQQISDAVGAWMAYGAEDAVLKNDPKEIEYWKNAYAAVTGNPQLKRLCRNSYESVPTFNAVCNKLSLQCKKGALELGKLSSVALNSRVMNTLGNLSVALNSKADAEIANRSAALGNKAMTGLGNKADADVANQSAALNRRASAELGNKAMTGLNSKAMTGLGKKSNEALFGRNAIDNALGHAFSASFGARMQSSLQNLGANSLGKVKSKPGARTE